MQLRNFFLCIPLVSAVSALEFTNRDFDNITLSTPFNITWSGAEGSTTLTLLEGGTYAYLKEAGIIASNITDSYYLWSPDSSLIRNVYSIRFDDSAGNTVHGFQFELLAPASEATPAPVRLAAKTATTSSTTYATTFTYPNYI